MTRNNEPPALFDAPPFKKVYGPVYKGVSRQINALKKAGHIDMREQAGTIAQARSIAESIDRASVPLASGRPSTAGMQLASLHERLESLLATLAPEQADADPFQELLNSLNDDQEGSPDGRPAEAPHPTE